MKSFTRRVSGRLSRTNIFVLLGLFVVLGGVSYAAINLPASSSSDDAKNQASAAAAAKQALAKSPDELQTAAENHQVLANKKSATVDSQALKPGTYLVKSEGLISNTLPPYNTKRQTECGIYNGSTQLASANAFNGAFDNKNPAESAAAFESIAMEATVTLKSGSTISIKCTPQDGSTRASMTLTAQRK